MGVPLGLAEVAMTMMDRMRSRAGRMAGVPTALAAAALSAWSAMAAPALAQDPRVVDPERYIPGIWIDPDGCEHWAMDDGTEGYMSPHRTRDGRPVCHRSEICGVMPTDQLFATDASAIGADNRARLEAFFRGADAFGFLIYGHTDARASDEYNIRLSNDRARAVAEVAGGVGARVVDVMGYGERQPRATNDTAEGLSLNRRVEIYCLR